VSVKPFAVTYNLSQMSSQKRRAPEMVLKLASKKPKASAATLVKVSPKMKSSSLNVRTGGFLGKELKFLDQEVAATSIVATVASSEVDPATTNTLNAVAQGDGPSDRDGNRYIMKSVHVRGYINWGVLVAGSTPAADTFIRLLVLMDTQTNGAQFNAEDVLVDPSSANLDTVTPRNLQYAARFKVLADKIIRQHVASTGSNSGDTVDTAGVQVPFEIFRKLNVPVQCTGTSANVTAITNNSLHVMAISSDNGTRTPTIRYFSRVRFID